jgi:iron complex outermembrane receptor protein
MRISSKSPASRVVVALVAVGPFIFQPACFAQSSSAAPLAASDAGLAEIVVTAEKRSERVQDVPMSITAATGAELQSLGITDTSQLEKLVPGFSVDKTSYGLPVYLIRGVGFNDSSLGVAPAVTVYTDQIPLPFSAMSRGAVMDIDRVEVLKGPQGTLFGENSTGGAINYVVAKPTSSFQAGADLTYGRFNQTDVEAFVSGPLTDTVSARLAVRNEYQGDWQKGYTVDETNGEKQFHNARLLVDWKPSDIAKFELMVTGWVDHSETEQPQDVAYTPLVVGPTARVVPYPVASYPAAPSDPRAAAWNPSDNLSQDTHLYQVALRGDINISDQITLTSLSSFERYQLGLPIDWSGTIYPIATEVDDGTISSLFEELRLDGSLGDRLKWMVGGNFEHDVVDEQQNFNPLITSGTSVGPFDFDNFRIDNDQGIVSKGGFGGIDFDVAPGLTSQSSVRYTSEDRSFSGCTRDYGNGEIASAIGFLSTLFTGTPQTIPNGACVTLSASGVPLPIVTGQLDQSNVSWRESLNWKPNRDTLLYANVTKGYKAGSFPTQPSSVASQFNPVPQESVLAYELGTKFTTPSHLMQLDGALFYYDYTDKQLAGYLVVPPFGPIPQLVSIPKAKVEGAEFSLVVHPYANLTLSANGTYIQTRVDQNPPDPTGPYGNSTSFVGQSFPFTPKWQGVFDAEYRFAISESLRSFAGASATSRSATTGALLSGAAAVAGEEAYLRVPGYTTLDLRAGIEPTNGPWRLEVWGRNVTDRLYVTGLGRTSDFTTRFAGMPATFGVSARYRFGGQE